MSRLNGQPVDSIMESKPDNKRRCSCIHDRMKAPASQIYASKNWSSSRVDVLEVTRGYWCDYRDRTFEREDWDGSPETKQYMHYFGYDRLADSEKLFRNGKLAGT